LRKGEGQLLDFLFSYLNLVAIFIILSLSTNLLVGIVGIFSVSQAAIFGLGAYIVGYCLVNDVMSFLPALAVAALASLVLNVLITLPSLRVSGDYFVVTSFGIQLLATAAFTNLTDITGGASGMPGIPPAAFFGITVDSGFKNFLLAGGGGGGEGGGVVLFVFPLFCLLLFAAAIASVWFALLMRAPFGRLLRAIREDELAVAAFGKNVLFAKVRAAGIAGVMAGAAGGLYAVYLSFIDPTTFDLNASVLLLTMVVLGGARTLAGSIVGPLVLLALPQLLAFIDIPNMTAAAVRQGIYGLLLILFMVFRPQGLMGQKL
jgi:branched-chain amino acid transport system permease protein